MIRFLLNAAVVVAGFGLALLLSVRHAHWGPEGPVGGGLLLIPFLAIAAAVPAILIARGTFSWVPGGRYTCAAVWVGLVIAFSVSGYYSMAAPGTSYERMAAASGWILLGGCLVAVNAPASTAAKIAIVATLGVGGVAGWAQVAAWLGDHAAQENQLAESRIASDRQFQEGMDAEFRGLGKDAPLWKYFSYLHISNEDLRKECHAIIAGRADRDARLSEYLGNEILALDATRYIGEFHPAPGPVLASAFGRRSDLLLSRMTESDQGASHLSERNYADIRDTVRAAVRIQKGGGDLTSQLEAWRSYLKRFKNAAELSAEIERTLPAPGAR